MSTSDETWPKNSIEPTHFGVTTCEIERPMSILKMLEILRWIGEQGDYFQRGYCLSAYYQVLDKSKGKVELIQKPVFVEGSYELLPMPENTFRIAITNGEVSDLGGYQRCLYLDKMPDGSFKYNSNCWGVGTAEIDCLTHVLEAINHLNPVQEVS